jgi:hypothetical protein
MLIITKMIGFERLLETSTILALSSAALIGSAFGFFIGCIYNAQTEIPEMLIITKMIGFERLLETSTIPALSSTNALVGSAFGFCIGFIYNAKLVLRKRRHPLVGGIMIPDLHWLFLGNTTIFTLDSL